MLRGKLPSLKDKHLASLAPKVDEVVERVLEESKVEVKKNSRSK